MELDIAVALIVGLLTVAVAVIGIVRDNRGSNKSLEVNEKGNDISREGNAVAERGNNLTEHSLRRDETRPLLESMQTLVRLGEKIPKPITPDGFNANTGKTAQPLFMEIRGELQVAKGQSKDFPAVATYVPKALNIVNGLAMTCDLSDVDIKNTYDDGSIAYEQFFYVSQEYVQAASQLVNDLREMHTLIAGGDAEGLSRHVNTQIELGHVTGSHLVKQMEHLKRSINMA